jgi:hypothetical protein
VAYNDAGDSLPSNCSGTTLPLCPVVPAAPSNFGHSGQTISAITWTWTDNADNEDGFRIDPSGELAPANASSVIETGLAANTSYTRHVHAYNTAGDSGPSNDASAYTLPKAPSATCDKSLGTPYPLPTTFTFTNTAGWGQGNLDHYHYVWDRNAAHSWSGTEPTWSSGTLPLTGDSTGNWYLHLVSHNPAEESGGTSDSGPYVVVVVKPAAPSNFGHSGQTTSSITWTWTDNADNEDGFRVHDGSEVVKATASVNATSAAEGGLGPNTSYTRHAHAYNTAGDSDPSNAATAYTLPKAPDVACDKSTGTTYAPGTAFTFTNQAGWGPGNQDHYHYVWDQSVSHSWTGGEATWAGSTLSQTGSLTGDWYLHVMSHNPDHESGGTADYGPYAVVGPPSPSHWLALWHFDEGDGTTAHDSSGHGNEGTLLPASMGGDGPTWTSDYSPNQADGYALQFDGVDDRVQATDIDLPSRILVRAWVKVLASTDYPQVVVSKWNPGSAGNYDLALTADTRPCFSVGFGSGSTGSGYSVTSNSPLLTDDRWHHLAGSYDGTRLALYVDDQSPVLYAVSGPVWQNDLLTTIGRSPIQGGESTYRDFHGVIDEVYIADQAGSFLDVYPTYWAFDQIEALRNVGITAGCVADNPGTPENEAQYCPAGSVTRAQMAVFLCRALGLDTSSPPSTPTFNDVPSNYWAYAYIEAFKNAGITAGCVATPPLFCPDQAVTRGQMAVFLCRALNLDTSSPPSTPTFSDAPTNYWAYAWIEAFKNAGITAGCVADDPATPQNEAQFCPNDPVHRDQMAVFLTRAFHLPLSP